MCGIFGYIGDKQAKSEVINGLKRLEYRGYDSWGVAVANEDSIEIIKKVGVVGNIDDLISLSDSHIGIGHTRWATHGGVTDKNAHPHFSTKNDFVVAQNGIVENYQELKSSLIKKGYKFKSETDTEVIVRLIENKLTQYNLDLIEAIRKAFLDLQGRNTIIILEKNAQRLIAVRNGSPLVVGVGENEVYCASDTLSFADRTGKVIYMNNNEMVICSKNKVDLFNVISGKKIAASVVDLNQSNVDIDKEGYEYYMIKEIIEQKHTIKEATAYEYEDLKSVLEILASAAKVYTIGAGTAGYAAGQIAYYLRKIANLNAFELKSYEVGSYVDILRPEDVMIVISQSGETADTIEAVEIAKSKGVKIISLVNMVGSTLSRLSDYQFYSRSGPEICVASTKAFTAQIVWGMMLAYSLIGSFDGFRKSIFDLSKKLDNYFSEDLMKSVKTLVKKIKNNEHFFVLGKDQNYYVALEGSLKVKEITYKHFEGFSAGELKHGVIALIEKDTPVFIITSDDEFENDMISAAAQVKARGAYVIGIANKENELYDTLIKTVNTGITESISKVIPFQLISYFMGLELGNNPDKPRNLAKSVTVK